MCLPATFTKKLKMKQKFVTLELLILESCSSLHTFNNILGYDILSNSQGFRNCLHGMQKILVSLWVLCFVHTHYIFSLVFYLSLWEECVQVHVFLYFH